MIQIHFEGRNAAEIKEQMLDFLSLPTLLIPNVPDPTPDPDPAPDAGAPAADVPKIDIADVRTACVAYRDKHGQAALLAAFEKVGAKKLPDVKPDRYAELMELVK